MQEYGDQCSLRGSAIGRGAWEYGLARETQWNMMRYSVPPDYRWQQSAKRPKLDPV